MHWMQIFKKVSNIHIMYGIISSWYRTGEKKKWRLNPNGFRRSTVSELFQLGFLLASEINCQIKHKIYV